MGQEVEVVAAVVGDGVSMMGLTALRLQAAATKAEGGAAMRATMGATTPGVAAAPVLQRLLLGLAGDSGGDAVLAAGCLLAEATGCAVDALHVVELPQTEGPDRLLTPEQYRDLRGEALRAARSGIEERYGHAIAHLNATVHILDGSSSSVIAGLGLALHSDLIVLGRHGRQGAFKLSSTVHAVIHQAGLPVWVQPRKFRHVKTILVAFDQSPEAREALRLGHLLARRLGGELHVVQALQTRRTGILAAGRVTGAERRFAQQQSAFHRSMDELDWRGLQHRTHFVDGEIGAVLQEAQREADLLVMGVRARRGLARWWRDSISDTVLEDTRIPLLLIQQARKRQAA